ncbi:MAG: hypothetical protein ACI83P_000110 [Janthinobacterium sp.]
MSETINGLSENSIIGSGAMGAGLAQGAGCAVSGLGDVPGLAVMRRTLAAGGPFHA